MGILDEEREKIKQTQVYIGFMFAYGFDPVGNFLCARTQCFRSAMVISSRTCCFVCWSKSCVDKSKSVFFIEAKKIYGTCRFVLLLMQLVIGELNANLSERVRVYFVRLDVRLCTKVQIAYFEIKHGWLFKGVQIF